MRQLLYISSSIARQPADLSAILTRSRRNNAAAGITGLLYTDGTRYLQVLEGPEESVGPTFERIRADPRHRGVVVLSDRTVATREFGDWSMAHRSSGDAADAFDDQMRRALSNASPSVQGTFLGLIAAREGKV